ncbi:MAG TPA: class I SAM-dependent methyltransferase [Terriglobia bacterium]|nr:class I SAM-dependent methyltransferase [Terriglobia bacterium]
MKSPRLFLQSAWLAVLLLAGGSTAPAWQLGSRPAADWIQTLERPSRVEGLKIDEIISHLKLRPGMVVADVGSGSGVFSRPLAKTVGPNGKVIAVDIEPGLLSYIRERAQKEGIPNIETHLGVPNDANLSGPVVDLALFHDSLHHIENREIYLKNLFKYIKPGGRVAIVDLDITDPDGPHKDQPEMQVSKDQIEQWMQAAGFRKTEDINLFPGEKVFLIYEKP